MQPHINRMKQPIAWTIAGSDSGGGAGIQADLHTFQGLSVYGCSVITAVTAQNSVAVTDIHQVSAENIAAQITALLQDLPPLAVKLGMLGNAQSVEVIKKFLAGYSGHVVFDPVLISTSAQRLFMEELDQRVAMLLSILPLVTLITPNIPEAEQLLGMSITSHEDMVKAAQKFLALGAASVVIKGGHLAGDAFSQDYWTDGREAFWLACSRQDADYHGSGCTFSAAIAAALTQGYALRDALVIGKMYVCQGITAAKQYGSGPAAVAHAGWPQQQQYLPWLSTQPLQAIPEVFPDCGSTRLGLYPVVDSVDWLKKLLPLGVSTIQLRIKNKTGLDLTEEMAAAVSIAREYNARLFINDYWELAIEYGAYGVHLGQEDLHTADTGQIKQAGLRLGISTHGYHELAKAHNLKPSYIAFGPIFATSSKLMPSPPQGIPQLRQWRRLLNCPLVAIGGIDTQRLPEILAAGADGIAVISAITQSDDPIKVTRQMLELMRVK